MKIPHDHTPHFGFFKFSNDNGFKGWIGRFQHGNVIDLCVGLHCEFSPYPGHHNAPYGGFYCSIYYKVVTIVDPYAAHAVTPRYQQEQGWPTYTT